MQGILTRLREKRWAHLLVANLRLLLGFAFLPAGLKKVLGQPFTDPDKHGPFHDFLHAFHATGGFYRFVGATQLVAAALLLTQVHATLGALIALPILTAIVALCWSTGVVPTAIVATLMWLSTAALVLWGVPTTAPTRAPSGRPPIDSSLWARCGGAILLAYLALTAMAGEVYRPRRVELDQPSFYLLVALPLVPLVAWWIERRRRSARPVNVSRP